MIARLAGTLVERIGTHVVIDCGGVGYDVICSAHTLMQLPPLGEPCTLRIFTQASENKVALFGFADGQERALFDLLITVKNVGPSTAISILSGGAGPRDIAALIAKEDVRGLTSVKGVGKKTAELLVVELREKCEYLVLAWSADGALRPVVGATTTPTHKHPLLAEAHAALVAMGWRPAEVDAGLAEATVESTTTLEQLIRFALGRMRR